MQQFPVVRGKLQFSFAQILNPSCTLMSYCQQQITLELIKEQRKKTKNERQITKGKNHA